MSQKPLVQVNWDSRCFGLWDTGFSASAMEQNFLLLIRAGGLWPVSSICSSIQMKLNQKRRRGTWLCQRIGEFVNWSVHMSNPSLLICSVCGMWGNKGSEKADDWLEVPGLVSRRNQRKPGLPIPVPVRKVIGVLSNSVNVLKLKIFGVGGLSCALVQDVLKQVPSLHPPDFSVSLNPPLQSCNNRESLDVAKYLLGPGQG